MTNLTLSIDEALLKKARIQALEQGTSLNAVVREFLQNYAGGPQKFQNVTAGLLEKAQTLAGDRGEKTWDRDELHER